MPYENGVWRPHRWEDWELELVDGNLETIGVLDEIQGQRLVWALYGFGDGSFSLSIQSDLAADLLSQAMFYIRAFRGGAQLRDFFISKDDRGFTVSNFVDDYIEIALSPLDAILQNHYCLPETPGETFKTPSLPLDDGVKWIVDHACGPNAYDGPGGSSRSLPGLVVAANVSAHPTTEEIEIAHKMDLFEFLQKFGPTNGIDWRVRLERTTGISNQMVFETFTPQRGLDKTEDNWAVRQPIILNDASSEVLSARRHRSAVGFANVVIGKSLGAEVTDPASIAIYGRRELLADTDESAKLEALLAERAQREGEELEFNPSEMVEIGEAEDQLGPGDTVTAGNQFLGIPSRDVLIRQIEFTIPENGVEQAKIVFGEYEKNLIDKLNESGGSGGGEYFDPIRGLRDDADTFVPFSEGDDYIWVKLATDEHLQALGDIGSNTITLSLVSNVDHSHAHADLTGVSANQHHNQAHVLATTAGLGADHTTSGLTTGYVLRASGATTAAFAQLQHSDLGGVTADLHHAGFIGLTVGVTSVNPDAGDRITLVQGSYVTLTPAAGQVTIAVSGLAESGHNHDHGTLTGLTDDDHTQYLLADGSRALTANWDAGAFKITSSYLQAGYLYVSSSSNFIRISSGTYFELQTALSYILFSPSAGSQWAMTSGAFYPWTTETKTVGTSTKRLSNLYSLDGNFSGRVTLDNAWFTNLTCAAMYSDTEFRLYTSTIAAQAIRTKGVQVSTSYGGSPIDNGILFYTDVTLYRSAANTLKTDDALYVTGLITAAGVATSIACSGNITMVAGATVDGVDISAHTHGLTFTETDTNTQVIAVTLGWTCTSTTGGPGHEHTYLKATSATASGHHHHYDKTNTPTGVPS